MGKPAQFSADAVDAAADPAGQVVQLRALQAGAPTPAV
jgi:hypothetical protein